MEWEMTFTHGAKGCTVGSLGRLVATASLVESPLGGLITMTNSLQTKKNDVIYRVDRCSLSHDSLINVM